jgi:hypothetical protein
VAPDDMKSAAEFWSWLVAHEARIRRDRSEAVLDEILAALHRYDPDLYFKIGGHPGGLVELVITAEGDRDHFDAVRALVAAAPAVEGWEFIAFSPAQGFHFVTEWDAARIDTRRAWFLPLVASSRPYQLGLRIAVADYDPADEQDWINAAHVVLDTALGELVAAERVQHVEVVALPPPSSSPSGRDDFRPLEELIAYLASRAS